MNVGQLKELLEQYDDEAEVLFMGQPSWPFEYSIAGVCTREDVQQEREPEGEWDSVEGEQPTDVFLVEGSQERYGDKLAWDVCQQAW